MASCVVFQTGSGKSIPFILILIDCVQNCIYSSYSRSPPWYILMFKHQWYLFIFIYMQTCLQIVSLDLLSLYSVIWSLSLMQLHWLMVESFLNQLFLSRLLLVQSQPAIETIDCVEVMVKIIKDFYLRISYFIKL